LLKIWVWIINTLSNSSQPAMLPSRSDPLPAEAFWQASCLQDANWSPQSIPAASFVWIRFQKELVMSSIRLSLILLLAVVLVEANCPLWGQTAQLAPPFATKLVDALATENSHSETPVCENGQCQGHPGGTDACPGCKPEPTLSSEDRRCELCPGSCDSYCLSGADADSDCECCVNKRSSQPQGSNHPATYPDVNQLDFTTSNYCRRMAKMLAITMEASPASSEDRQKAIESALMMVAQSVQAQASARIRENETRYHRELAMLRAEFARLAAVNEANDQIRQWMTPFYANQNRNFRQLQVLDAKQVAFNQTLKMLEHRIAQNQSTRPSPPIKPATVSVNLKDERPRATSRPPQRSGNLEQAMEIQQQIKIQQQINELQKQLQQIPSSVRPAGHLEPLFTPDQPLKPISKKR
jgi:hypothetical protein